MAKFKRVTPKTLQPVWARFTVEYVQALIDEQDNSALKAFCADFNHFLDDLRDQDAFGTEGQCDPRGDPRS